MKNINGFTLIELLVVIAIIGLLSTIAIVALNQARSKARDAQRMHDLDQIRKALQLYYDKNGNWIETGSGYGYNGNGYGWFNADSGSYYSPPLKPIAQALIDAGLTENIIIDPSGNKSSTYSSGHAYMKYHCGTPTNRIYLYAKLETLPQSNTATDGTCCASCDQNYGINYYISVQ